MDVGDAGPQPSDHIRKIDGHPELTLDHCRKLAMLDSGMQSHSFWSTGFVAQICFIGSLLILTGKPAGAQSSAASPSLSPLETKMVRSIDVHGAADLALLQQIVDINSGTMHLAGVEAVKDVLVPRFESLGFKVRWVSMQSQTGRAGDLVAEHLCPAGEGQCGTKLLLIGHMDTVFEPSSSFQKYALASNTNGKIATGPGIADMKGGLVVMLAALRAMNEAGSLEHSEIRIVLSGDEERVGDPILLARRDLIEAAKQSDVALEFEPSVRLNGQDTVSIARRSSTTWHIETTGISGHSSQIFGDRLGYGAIFELARILDAFRKELPEEGLTYNVGLVLGGATAQLNQESTGGSATGKANVVAPKAMAVGDLRTLNDEQTTRVETTMRAIVANHLAKTGATITFDESYPAMARTQAGEKLFSEWSDVSVALGFGPVLEGGPMTRGAGDISFTAKYVPGLVGVGMLGEGYHAEGETAYLESFAMQAKRDAVLMERLSHQPSGH
jgi:glutamate carboxypeptidase